MFYTQNGDGNRHEDGRANLEKDDDVGATHMKSLLNDQDKKKPMRGKAGTAKMTRMTRW